MSNISVCSSADLLQSQLQYVRACLHKQGTALRAMLAAPQTRAATDTTQASPCTSSATCILLVARSARSMASMLNTWAMSRLNSLHAAGAQQVTNMAGGSVSPLVMIVLVENWQLESGGLAGGTRAMAEQWQLGPV